MGCDLLELLGLKPRKYLTAYPFHADGKLQRVLEDITGMQVTKVGPQYPGGPEVIALSGVIKNAGGGDVVGLFGKSVGVEWLAGLLAIPAEDLPMAVVAASTQLEADILSARLEGRL